MPSINRNAVTHIVPPHEVGNEQAHIGCAEVWHPWEITLQNVLDHGVNPAKAR